MHNISSIATHIIVRAVTKLTKKPHMIKYKSTTQNITECPQYQKYLMNQSTWEYYISIEILRVCS